MNADKSRDYFQLVGRYIAAAMIIGCLGAIGLSLFGAACAFLLFEYDSGPTAPDPPHDFRQLTGWTLPADAQVLYSENTFSGFKNDGDYTLIVKTSPGRVKKWVSISGSNVWKQCPIPTEIQDSCRNLPNHNGQFFRADKVANTDPDWHRGSLVIVNPKTGMIWVYAWKH